MMILYPYGLRKALTLSYDDGVETDIELIRILDEYGILATFNLNSGCFAPEGTVYPAGTIHRRMSESAVKALYAGGRHEVASHALTHASLSAIPAPRGEPTLPAPSAAGAVLPAALPSLRRARFRYSSQAPFRSACSSPRRTNRPESARKICGQRVDIF